MFNHILLPLDRSSLAECVLPYILPFVQASHTQVTLLNVLDQVPTPYSSTTFDAVKHAIGKAEAQAYLYEISNRLSGVGVLASTALSEGKAADCIIQYAHDHKVDLIALSSHGTSGFSGWNINSVVQKVLLRAYTSVLIIPAYQPVMMEIGKFQYQKIFIALDGSSRAECVLPISLECVAHQHASLLIAIAIPKPELPSHLPLNLEEVEIVARVVDRNRRYAEEYLKLICSRFHEDLYEIHTCIEVCENPVDALHDLVEGSKADLVILSAHGCTGSCKRPYGSVTLSFIAYGTTPLLIFQDIPSNRFMLSQAEMAVRERSGH